MIKTATYITKQKRWAIILTAILIAVTLVSPVYAANTEQNLSIADALALGQKGDTQYTSLSLQVDRAEILRENASDNITLTGTGQLIVNPSGQALVNSYEQTNINLKTLKKQLENEQIANQKEVISAYTSALITANKIKATRLSLADMQNQQKINLLARDIGVYSAYANDKYNDAIEQLKDTLASQEISYNGDIATLRSLFNKGTDWKPVLTSQVVAGSFSRQPLATEVVRATTASSAMTSVEAARDLERIKIYFPAFDGEDRYMDNISSNLKELEYESTKRDTWSTVEQLYHGIDALEKQIVISEKTLAADEKDLKLAQIKYDLGLIPLRSIQTGTETLESYKLAVEKAKIDLDTMRCQLVANKASYCYLTGQNAYSSQDWK